MNNSQRECLRRIPRNFSPNAGLLFDRFLTAQLEREEKPSPDRKSGKELLIEEVANLASDGKVYSAYYRRWIAALESMGAQVDKEASALGRVVVNLGAESVLEASLALHHTYGVPYLPGAALKGLAAFYARKWLKDSWGKDSEAYKILFGDTEVSGCVTFFDCLLIPGSGYLGKPLWKDVITVHHQKYYQGELVPPADWDSPTIIHFLSATGSYLIPLAGPEEWVNATYKILRLALSEEGIGAKTNSGYGIMILGDPPETHHKESYVERRNRLLSEDNLDGDRVRSLVREVKDAGEYGFCDAPGGGKDIYLKPTFFKLEGQKLQEGQLVEYQIMETESGPQAREMIVLLEPK